MIPATWIPFLPPVSQNDLAQPDLFLKCTYAVVGFFVFTLFWKVVSGLQPPNPHPDNNSQEREQHRKLLWEAGEAEMPPQDEVVLAEIFIYVKRKHRSVLPFGCCSWCLSWLVCQIWFNLLGPPSQPKPRQRCSRQYAFVYPCLFRLMPLINELDWRRWGDYLVLENVV